MKEMRDKGKQDTQEGEKKKREGVREMSKRGRQNKK